MNLWFGLLFVFAMEPIPLDSFGTFQNQNFRLFQVGSHFLALAGVESQLTLFTKEGKILAVYKKAEQGPEGLIHPQFLGVDKANLYILSGGRTLMIFDHQLTLRETRPSELPPYISQGFLFGLALPFQQFLLFAFRQDNRLLHLAQLDLTLQHVDSFYRRNGRLEASGTYQWVHSDRHFVAEMIPANSTIYSVEVRATPRTLTESPPELVTELVAPVDAFGLTSFREKAILSEMAVLPQGYLVEFAALPARGIKGPEDYGKLEYFWDYFNFKGANLARESAGDRRIKPVLNGTAIFMVEPQSPDTEVLKLYSQP